MADYLSFAGGIPLLDTESSDSKEELNISDLALEEEPIIQFNNPNVAAEILATVLVHGPNVSKKRPRDIALNEEELIEGSGLFVNRPHISRCSDTRK